MHTTDETPRRITVEDILGDFGFRVRWSVLDHWANVEVYKIESRDVDGPLFVPDGGDDADEKLSGIDGADTYLDGHIKWDGCTELDMGCPHWCGPMDYAKHTALLHYLWHRAFELMGRPPEDEWPSDAAIDAECGMTVGATK